MGRHPFSILAHPGCFQHLSRHAFVFLDPLEALKSKLSISRGDANFRRILVVAQFVSSVILITGTFVVYRQLDYIRSKDLGYDKAHVLTFGCET